MAMDAGSVAIRIEATGVQEFAAKVQKAIESLKKMGLSAGQAADLAQKLRSALGDSGNELSKWTSLAKAAAGAATAFAATKIGFAMANAAHQTQVASSVFNAMGGDLEGLRKATQGMISDAELVKKANLAQTMGINEEAFKSLSAVALAAAAKTGQSVDYLFESIMLGTARQSKMILDNLGIIVPLESAQNKYAQSLGKSASALTENEKKQAFMNAVMAQGSEVLSQLDKAGISVRNPFAEFEASAKNAQGTIGGMLIPTFEKLFDIIDPIFKAISALGAGWASLNPQIKGAIGSVGAVTIAIIALAAAFTTLMPIMRIAFLPLLKAVAIAAAIVVAVELLKKAWTTNFLGIRDVTAKVWKWIKDNAATVAIGLLTAFFWMGQKVKQVFGGLARFLVGVFFVIPEVIGTALDMLTEMFSQTVREIAGLAKKMGLDGIADKLNGVAAGAHANFASGGYREKIADERKNVQGLFDVEDIDARGMAEAFASELTGMVTDLSKWAFPDDKSKSTGKIIGGAAADTVTEAVLKAQVAFREALRDLIAENHVGSIDEVFRPLVRGMYDAEKHLDDLSKKAHAAGMALSPAARAMVVQNYAREAAAATNGIASLEDFNTAVVAGRGIVESLGGSLADFNDELKYQPASLSDALTKRVGSIFDAVSNLIDFTPNKNDRRDLVGTISKAIGQMIKGESLDLSGVGEMIGKAFGATKEGGDLLKKAFGVIAGSGSAIGGAIGGAAGAGVGAIVGVVVPMVTEAFQKVTDAIVGIVQAIPEAVSAVANKVASFVPETRFQGGTEAAFNPMIIAAGQAATALTLIATLVAPLALALGGLFAPAIAIVSGMLIGMAPVIAAAIVGLAAAVTAIVGVMAIIDVAIKATILAAAAGFTIVAVLFVSAVLIVSVAMQTVAMAVLLAVPPIAVAFVAIAALSVPVIIAFALIAAAVLAVVAVMAVLMGAIMMTVGFFKLAMDTESFKRFKAAFEGSVDRIVKALEPFFNNLMALAGLFDALVSVIIPLAAAFANNEMMARVMFDVFKGVAIMIAAFALAIGVVITVLLAGVIAVASGFSLLIVTLSTFKDGMLMAVQFVLQAVLNTFGKFMPQALQGVLSTWISQLGSSQGMSNATKTTAKKLDDLANAAGAMSPNLDEMAAAMRVLMGLTYDESDARARTLAKEKAASAELTNVPEGFKVAAARFRAIAADPSDSRRFGLDDGTTASSGGITNNYVVEHMELHAASPEDLFNQMREQAERSSFQQSGGAFHRDGAHNGRGR